MKKTYLFIIITFFNLSCDKDVYLNGNDFREYTIEMIQSGYKNEQFTVVDVVKYYLNSIELIDKSGPSLNSVISINSNALIQAAKLDKKLLDKEPISQMFGIPVMLKDNINTLEGMPTTAGSRVLAESYPNDNSWIAKKLKDSNAIILGKANLSEWANYRSSFSSSGWSGINGQTKNPYVLSRNPCGSSSGSAVAVSANLCAVAIGTETWGSIMCPSSATGIVGIKPTVGLWSRTGIVPISYTQDTPGPMARTLKDACILLGALTGIDSTDKKTLDSRGHFQSDYLQFLDLKGLEGKRIGYLKTQEGKNFKVDKLVKNAISIMEKSGAKIIELDKIVEGEPHKNSREVMAYEFKSGINKYLNDLGDNRPVNDLSEIISWTYNDSIEMQHFDLSRMESSQKKGNLDEIGYTSALSKMLTAYQKNGIDYVMDKDSLDAIICPTGGPAWKTDLINGDNFSLSSSVNAALSGYPNITIPMGFIQKLPVGISFFGRKWSEPVLIEIAYAYEQITMHRKTPEFIEYD